jgi:hypothetical protein
VAFESDAPLARSHACHCTICRRLHGSAYGAYALARKPQFRFTRGEAGIARYASSSNGFRWFCARCGSVLPERHVSGDQVGIPIGTLDDAGPELRMRAHIFVESRAPWHEITDSLPRFDTWPPAYQLGVHPTPAREPSPDGEITGSCLCNAVAYALSRPPREMRSCHCSRCRKARAAPFATNALTDLAGFRFTRGEDQLSSYRVPGARYFMQVFCKICSAPMPRVDPSRDLVVIPGGSFDGDPGVRPAFHIFAGSKAPWFEVTDGLPTHAESA